MFRKYKVCYKGVTVSVTPLCLVCDLWCVAFCIIPQHEFVKSAVMLCFRALRGGERFVHPLKSIVFVTVGHVSLPTVIDIVL